jgi:hypothetical protein
MESDLLYPETKKPMTVDEAQKAVREAGFLGFVIRQLPGMIDTHYLAELIPDGEELRMAHTLWEYAPTAQDAMESIVASAQRIGGRK